MSPRPKKTESHRDPLAELARMKVRVPNVSPAHDAARPADTESRRYREILDVAVSLTSTLELKPILDTIVDGIIRVTGMQRGYVILRDSDGELAMFTGRTREGSPWDEQMAREISHTVVKGVVETHELVVRDDVDKIQGLREQESILAERIRSVICLPLIYQDRLIGVIYADSGFVLSGFSDADRDLLRAFGAQAAVAIANARRHGEILDRGDRLEEQNRQLREQLSQHVTMSKMVIRNKRMLEVFSVAQKIAPTDVRVLIRGESGTGKELVARAIHEMSRRSEGPFVAVDCNAIPSTLFESHFFGHCKGAFSGADSDRPGLFEVAKGGTLFIDEIGDAPVEVQPKLLRALQEREISRVGEPGHMRPIDVRVVTATNRDMARLVAEGKFREDLYFRLNGVELVLPPLRERPEDILPLAEYFLAKYAGREKQQTPQLSRDARRYLLENRWQGNVRQLESMMEVALAFQDEHGVIHAGAFDRQGSGRDAGANAPESAEGSLRDLMERFEARVIRDALARNDSNVSSTAKALGLSRQMLHEKIRKYGIVTRGE